MSERKGSGALVGCRVNLGTSSPAPGLGRAGHDDRRSIADRPEANHRHPLVALLFSSGWGFSSRPHSDPLSNTGQEHADSGAPELTAGGALYLLAKLHSRPGRTGHSLRSTVVRLNNWQEPSTLFHTPTTSSATVGFCVGAVEKSLDEHAGSRQSIDTCSPGKLVPSVTRSATAFLVGGTLGGNGSSLLPMKGDLSLWTCLFASIYGHYRLEPSIPL